MHVREPEAVEMNLEPSTAMSLIVNMQLLVC